MKSVILLSGGLDSCVAAAWAIDRWGPGQHGLTVDYGQRHAFEIRCADHLAKTMGLRWHTASVRLPYSNKPLLAAGQLPVPTCPVLPGRNAVLLSLALALAQDLGADAIVFGANADDQSGFPDCRESFLRAFDALARPIELWWPLIDMHKTEIVQLGRKLEAPISQTLSCYDPVLGTHHCMVCGACRLRQKAFAEA